MDLYNKSIKLQKKRDPQGSTECYLEALELQVINSAVTLSPPLTQMQGKIKISPHRGFIERTTMVAPHRNLDAYFLISGASTVNYMFSDL